MELSPFLDPAERQRIMSGGPPPGALDATAEGLATRQRGFDTLAAQRGFYDENPLAQGLTDALSGQLSGQDVPYDSATIGRFLAGQADAVAGAYDSERAMIDRSMANAGIGGGPALAAKLDARRRAGRAALAGRREVMNRASLENFAARERAQTAAAGYLSQQAQNRWRANQFEAEKHFSREIPRQGGGPGGPGGQGGLSDADLQAMQNQLGGWGIVRRRNEFDTPGDFKHTSRALGGATYDQYGNPIASGNPAGAGSLGYGSVRGGGGFNQGAMPDYSSSSRLRNNPSSSLYTGPGSGAVDKTRPTSYYKPKGTPAQSAIPGMSQNDYYGMLTGPTGQQNWQRDYRVPENRVPRGGTGGYSSAGVDPSKKRWYG
jgi:hypothetical protein